MHPADIQALLKKRGITQHEIAVELEVSDMSVSREIRGIASSERIRRAIAKRLGMDRKIVFPEYYMKKARR